MKRTVSGRSLRAHAYNITAINTVETHRGTETLLRIRNFWGNDKEWQGSWADGSSEWNAVSREQLQRMQVEFGADGEIW